MTDPLDNLYGAPLDEFTARRNDLVKWLKANGEKAEAVRIGQLKKPSVPAWTINQLARRESDAVENLIGIQRSLGEASGAKELQKLGADRRRAVTSLTEKARKILAEAGSASGAATLEKISSSLLAATSEEDLELLRAGRLEKEFTSSGFEGAFGGLATFEVASEERIEEQEPVDPEAARRAREHAEYLAKEADKYEKKARSLAEKVTALEAQLEEARKAAEAQAEAAAALRQQADEALAGLSDESPR